MIESIWGTTTSSRFFAQGIGISMEETLSMGASRQSKPDSLTMAAISAPIPDCGNPSQTVTILLVLARLSMIVSLSMGFMVLRLMTSQEIPSFSSSAAASRENLTFLEYATIVTSFPSLMILALPIGRMKSSPRASSLISKCQPQRFSFSKNITTSLHLIAAFRSPLLSSASQGAIVIIPGIFEYHEAKHWECWAATAAAGPLRPRNTIPPPSYPPLMQ